jgi:hypothetical protein
VHRAWRSMTARSWSQDESSLKGCHKGAHVFADLGFVVWMLPWYRKYFVHICKNILGYQFVRRRKNQVLLSIFASGFRNMRDREIATVRI